MHFQLARQRLAIATGLELAGFVLLATPLLSSYRGIQNWQIDCRYILGVAFVPLAVCTMLVLAATHYWKEVLKWTDYIIGGLYLANLLVLMMLILRTGGPGVSFYAPLPPIMLSMILLSEQQRRIVAPDVNRSTGAAVYGILTIGLLIATEVYKKDLSPKIIWNPGLPETDYGGWVTFLTSISMALLMVGYYRLGRHLQ